ncbi:MAG: thiamine phosphate synthase [Hyphomicrobiales bacterium]|nr:thiamine phosphate synthase [Hyphomicrobiales bacterium]
MGAASGLSDGCQKLCQHTLATRQTNRSRAKEITLLNNKRKLPDFLLVTDETRFPNPLPILETLPRSSGVVFRHYRHPQREELAESVAALCRRRRLILLVANDVPLALRVRAQGVHLPQWRWEGSSVRRPFDEFRITGSVHSPGALARASRSGMDAVMLSPVFATDSHPRAEALGAARASAWARLWGRGIPVYALGGVDDTGRRRLRGGCGAGTAATRWRG